MIIALIVLPREERRLLGTERFAAGWIAI